MRMYDIINKKKLGKALTLEEISFFVKGYTEGSIPDYQAAALLMAIFLNGMSDEETVLLTQQMAGSGEEIDLSRFKDRSVDKHSTGGVGDKTTLIVAPIVASLGGYVTKMSGRGLGHTGGTVDKLESIDGYKTTLSKEEFLTQVEEIGISVIGQSTNLAPADKKLYALRDVTATVDSIPLITSSIMSKKIASGSKNIVLDVKVGSGAFMKNINDAEKLARNMVNIGKGCNRCVAAVLTDMDCPLGNAVGNNLEVIEAISVLKGESRGDLFEVSVALASVMVSLVLDIDEKTAREKVIEAIESGKAFNKMKEWIKRQGGNIELIENPELFKKAKFSKEIVCKNSGYIEKMDAEKIGLTALILGAGRNKKDDVIDASAGILINKKVGDRVFEGDILCTLFGDNEDSLVSAEKMYRDAVLVGNKKTERNSVIYKIIR